jgi:predicted DsbA family dithiol-disulfide isomerase
MKVNQWMRARNRSAGFTIAVRLQRADGSITVGSKNRGKPPGCPNRVIYIAEKLGKGPEVLEALKNEGLIKGRFILRQEVALDIAIAASGIKRAKFESYLDDPATIEEIRATTAEFSGLPGNQRPTFVIRSAIDDTAIFSGLYRPEPILSALAAMIADEDSYERFASSHPPIPQ